MKPERWQQIRALLESAMELEPAQRAHYLERRCLGDPSLRQDVDSFLAVEHELRTSFLESPAVGRVVPNANAAPALQWAASMKLGPYLIQSMLGSGGMGEVYRARDTRLGRDVAIKVLPALLSTDADRLRRFKQEARAAPALNHPNICTVHDIGEDGGWTTGTAVGMSV